MGLKERMERARQNLEINRLRRKGRIVRRKIESEKTKQEQEEFDKDLAEETKKARRETYREEAIKQAKLEGTRVAERRATRGKRFKEFAKKTGMSMIKKPTAVRRAPIRRVKRRAPVKRTTTIKRRKTVRRTPVKRVVRRASTQ